MIGELLSKHVGHRVEIVEREIDLDVWEVSLECKTCGITILKYI